jgi:hypothetical protein
VRLGRASQVSAFRGDHALLRSRARDALVLARQAGADRSAARELMEVTEAALLAGDLDEAIATGREAAQAFRALNHPANLAVALTQVCNALLLKGDVEAARLCATEALPSMWRMQWGVELAVPLASIAVTQGRHDSAARMLGYAQAWFETHSERPPPYSTRLMRQAGEAIDAARAGRVHRQVLVERSGLGERGLSDGEAFALAREVLAPSPTAAGPGGTAS